MNSHIQRIGVLKVKSCYSTQQATPSRRPQWCGVWWTRPKPVWNPGQGSNVSSRTAAATRVTATMRGGSRRKRRPNDHGSAEQPIPQLQPGLKAAEPMSTGL